MHTSKPTFSYFSFPRSAVSRQPDTQIFMYLIYQDFNKCAHLRSVVINQSVIEAAQDLCITLTAPRGNENKSTCVHLRNHVG